MTEPTQVANPMEMVVTTNSAPVEQQSPEMVTTDPKIPEPEVSDAIDAPLEPSEEVTPDPKDNELAREKIQEKMRADSLQRQIDESRPKDSIPDKEPDINDYKTLEEYKTDYRKWAKEEGRREERLANQQQEQAKQQAKIRADVETRQQKSREKHADYDSVVSPIVPVIASVPLLKDFVAKNPMGTEVVYELAKNPAILDQIMKSDVWEAGERLLNIAARLKKPAAPQISNAPEPIKPVGSRETVKPKLAELASKDINGYIAKRNKDELARRRTN